MVEKHVILCVDDEEGILRSLERLLRIEGYDILTASCGPDGLDILEKQHVDLIIVDQRMPEMNGSEFLRIVRKKYPQIVSIMLSGYSDFDDLVSAINEGEIFRFVAKPWDFSELKEIIRQALEQKKVIKVIENLILSVCDVVKIADNVSIKTSNDQKCIDLKLGNEHRILSKDVIFKFINLLLDAIGIDKEKKLHIFSGAITKKKGAIILSMDIGKGILLRILLPSLKKGKQIK